MNIIQKLAVSLFRLDKGAALTVRTEEMRKRSRDHFRMTYGQHSHTYKQVDNILKDIPEPLRDNNPLAAAIHSFDGNERIENEMDEMFAAIKLAENILERDRRMTSARRSFTPEDIKNNRIEALRVMKEAEQFQTLQMDFWMNKQAGRQRVYEAFDNTQHGFGAKALHKCGNTACFAGHLRVDQYFIDKYKFLEQSAPQFKTFGSEVGIDDTIALMLGIPNWFARLMIYGQDEVMCSGPDGTLEEIHRLYTKSWELVDALDVAAVLEDLISGKDPHDIFNDAEMVIDAKRHGAVLETTESH